MAEINGEANTTHIARVTKLGEEGRRCCPFKPTETMATLYDALSLALIFLEGDLAELELVNNANEKKLRYTSTR
jgi:hypothetical protein